MSDRSGRVLRIIGVGNRDRGDDAAGPIVCDRIAELDLVDIETAVVEAGGIDLAAYWDGDDRVVVVDALPPDGHPGRVVTIDALAQPVRSPASLSTHAVDVGASIELARVLDALPRELTIIGIEAVGFEFGAGLSAAAEPAVADVVDRLTTRAGRRVGDR